MIYLNEHDKHAADWLRNLMADGVIPEGFVDDRDIQSVQATDLVGYRQCHFFSGVGGWCEALRIAGWDERRPVWTGSCPCQDFSSAGKREGHKGERHLWPDFYRLIRECRPETIFGEQVASSEVIGTELEAAFLVAVQAGDYARANKLAKRCVASSGFHFHQRWVDGVRTDLEAAGYSFRACVVGSHSVGAPHIRQRLYWMATPVERQRGLDSRLRESSPGGRDAAHHAQVAGCGPDGGLEHAAGNGRGERRPEPSGRGTASGCGDGRMGNTFGEGREGSSEGGIQRGFLACDGGMEHATSERRSQYEWRQREREEPIASSAGFWDAYSLIPCRDGKARRVEPGLECLVDGSAFRLADGRTREGVSRAAVLRGIGNAVNVYQAAAFIRAVMETI